MPRDPKEEPSLAEKPNPKRSMRRIEELRAFFWGWAAERKHLTHGSKRTILGQTPLTLDPPLLCNLKLTTAHACKRFPPPNAAHSRTSDKFRPSLSTKKEKQGIHGWSDQISSAPPPASQSLAQIPQQALQGCSSSRRRPQQRQARALQALRIFCAKRNPAKGAAKGMGGGGRGDRLSLVSAVGRIE